jgi:hypothetical protein
MATAGVAIVAGPTTTAAATVIPNAVMTITAIKNSFEFTLSYGLSLELTNGME